MGSDLNSFVPNFYATAGNCNLQASFWEEIAIYKQPINLSY